MRSKQVFGLSAIVLALVALSVEMASSSAFDGLNIHISDHKPDLAESPESTGERSYLAQNDVAMGRMMGAMAGTKTRGVDSDFVAMMVPHHQGAVDMAVLFLRYGHNEKLRRIAQEIIVEQQQEIVAMRLALGQPLPPSMPAPTKPATLPHDMKMK